MEGGGPECEVLAWTNIPGGGGVWGGGGPECEVLAWTEIPEGVGWTIPNATLSPDLDDFFIQFGSDESPLNKSLIVRGKVTIQCP